MIPKLHLICGNNKLSYIETTMTKVTAGNGSEQVVIDRKEVWGAFSGYLPRVFYIHKIDWATLSKPGVRLHVYADGVLRYRRDGYTGVVQLCSMNKYPETTIDRCMYIFPDVPNGENVDPLSMYRLGPVMKSISKFWRLYSSGKTMKFMPKNNKSSARAYILSCWK